MSRLALVGDYKPHYVVPVRGACRPTSSSDRLALKREDGEESFVFR
ncbi:hypothetical protein [Vibrio rhodolitus]|nr:hypothetical protein [Vibrio rhodolitus]